MDWREIFYYDETSPTCLRWKIETRCGWNNSVVKTFFGKVAGGVSISTGYHQINIKGKVYRVHRIIYEMSYGGLSKTQQVDHINGIRTDNRLSNLRRVTGKENQRNRCLQSNSETGVCGVVIETKTVRGVEYLYFVALCPKPVGSGNIKKYFSIAKHGKDTAFKLACECRDESIVVANAAGGGFTERHGKAQLLKTLN